MVEYVNNFNFYGKEVKEIPCVSGYGEPKETPEAFGLLLVDHETGTLYKSVYQGQDLVWEKVSPDVLAESGKDPKAVMSQKAVTDFVEESKVYKEWMSIDGEMAVGNLVSSGRINTSISFYHTLTVPVDEGEKYRLTSYMNSGKDVIMAVFLNETEALVGNRIYSPVESGYGLVKDYEVIAPAGAKMLRLTSRFSDYAEATEPSIEKYAIETVKEAVARIEVSAEENKNALFGKADKDELAKAQYEIENLERRATRNEKLNDFTWGEFDKAYFIFVHDDNNSYLPTACNVFHEKGVPLSCASMANDLQSKQGGKTVKEWLDEVVADGGEVLCHYSGDLLNTTEDEVWYEKVVASKKVFEENGFVIRGLIRADSTEARTEKGEKFCRKYYDYADSMGTSDQYKLGRTLMLNYSSLEAFKSKIDACAMTNGIYAFGFHGSQFSSENWLTQSALEEIIDYISAKENCVFSTYMEVFDTIGTTVLEKRLSALEG